MGIVMWTFQQIMCNRKISIQDLRQGLTVWRPKVDSCRCTLRHNLLFRRPTRRPRFFCKTPSRDVICFLLDTDLVFPGDQLGDHILIFSDFLGDFIFSWLDLALEKIYPPPAQGHCLPARHYLTSAIFCVKGCLISARPTNASAFGCTRRRQHSAAYF